VVLFYGGKMCISFLFVNSGEYSIKYKLILINNRDEYFARATQNATLSAESINPDLSTIYGVDLAGAVEGTWLGVSANKGTVRLGNLANISGEENNGRRGRGPIVTDFIKGSDSIEDYTDRLSSLSHEFSSFNFLSVEMKSNEDMKMFYISNSPKRLEKLTSNGFIGLGNSPMSSPFKKVENGTELFKAILESHKDKSKEELIAGLMNLLKSDTKHYPDEELHARLQDTAEQFSSIHVNFPDLGYGTRTRTVILVDEDHNLDYIEETMASEDPEGCWETTRLTITNKPSSD
jgi:uncharacterized protein with NRDE domain